MNAPVDSASLNKARATRNDGWSRERRRTFLESLAEGHTVEAACVFVGLSKASAYALRRRDHGFALGWSAASLCGRKALSDTLTSRALDGQVETWTRADGTSVTRHRHDNRFALAVLTRLDRLADLPDNETIGTHDAASARGVAHDFDAYLDLLDDPACDDAAIGTFVDARIRQLRQLNGAKRGDEIDREYAGESPRLREIIRSIVHVGIPATVAGER